MKKFLTLFLISAMFLSLVSCGENAVEVSEDVSEAVSAEESSEVIPPHEPYGIAYANNADGEAAAAAVRDHIAEKSGIDCVLEAIETEEDVKEGTDIVIGIIPSFVEIPYTPMYHGDHGYVSKEGKVYIFGADADSLMNAAIEFENDCVSSDGIAEDITDKTVFLGFPFANDDKTVNGAHIKDFTIACATTENEAKYEDIAAFLKEYLLAEGNFELPISTSKTATYEKEIVIGYTSRRGSLYESKKEAEYGIEDYRILFKGTKVYIEANNACGAYHAVMHFLGLFNGEDIKDQDITGSHPLIKVACVGDSITQGNNSADYHKTAYPVYLQRMLGYDYYVKNYGASGYSVVFEDQYSYSKDSRYKAALDLKADVMIFMLGTNDGNPKDGLKDWEGTNREQRYYNNVNEYLDSFLETNPDMQIFMCLPAPLFSQSTRWGDWEEWARRIVDYVIPLNRKVAEERNLPIIDIYSWAVKHPEMFPDGLHPLEETYCDYAKRVYDEIMIEWNKE